MNRTLTPTQIALILARPHVYPAGLVILARSLAVQTEKRLLDYEEACGHLTDEEGYPLPRVTIKEKVAKFNLD